MNKIIIIAILIGLICSTFFATPVNAISDDDFNEVMSGFGVEQGTDRQWLACARKAVEAAEKKMRADGIKDNFWGMAGTGMISTATEECGYLESPKMIPKWAMDIINEQCYWKPDAVDYEIFNRPFYKYHPDYLEKTVMSECKKVYSRKASIAKRKTEKSKQDAENARRKADANAKVRATGLQVSRVYSPVDGITKAIIKTNRDRAIKCAALSSAGEYLSVVDTLITAPVDEVIFFVDAYSVKCWPR